MPDLSAVSHPFSGSVAVGAAAFTEFILGPLQRELWVWLGDTTGTRETGLVSHLGSDAGSPFPVKQWVRVWCRDPYFIQTIGTSVFIKALDAAQTLYYSDCIQGAEGPGLPIGAATKAAQTDGSQLARAMLNDGAGKQVQALGEVSGKLQCDVKTSALPTGAAAEATLAKVALASQLPAALVGGKLSVTDPTALPLPAGAATDSEVKKLVAESTFTAWADVKASTLAKASSQTDGGQKTQVVDSKGADVGGNLANLDAKSSALAQDATLTGGSQVTKVHSGDGVVITASGSALDVEAGSVVTAINTEGDTAYDISWGPADDGTTQHEIATGLAVGTVVWIIGVFGLLSASAGGAATWVVHASATTGWTIGDASEHYESAAIPVADPITSSIPTTPAMFKLTASGKLFVRIVPNAGTTAGAAQVFVARRRP
jgi:hypothetical protein